MGLFGTQLGDTKLGGPDTFACTPPPDPVGGAADREVAAAAHAVLPGLSPSNRRADADAAGPVNLPHDSDEPAAAASGGAAADAARGAADPTGGRPRWAAEASRPAGSERNTAVDFDSFGFDGAPVDIASGVSLPGDTAVAPAEAGGTAATPAANTTTTVTADAARNARRRPRIRRPPPAALSARDKRLILVSPSRRRPHGRQQNGSIKGDAEP